MLTGIKENSGENRFEMRLDGETAYVAYRRMPESINYISTFVPDALRGQGVGSALVEYALDYAAEKGLIIIPTCPFVREYIDKYKRYRGA